MIVNRYSDINKEDSSLRPYQQKAKREIFESWDEVDNVMFQMPTGTGKTRLFTSIIRDINDYSKQRREPVKILIIAHRTELIDQIDESLRRYQVAHNVIAGGRDRNYKFPVNVASIQTITHPNNLSDAKKLNVQFVIIDEAHHALAATYKKLWKLYPGSKKLGVTATPWRMNHQSFTDLFDKLVLSMPIKDFIKLGFLASYKYFSLRSDSNIQSTIDDIELDRFGEYKESSMEEKMDIGSIRAQLLDSYLSLAEGKKGIIYAINIVHAQHICEEYKKAGYIAVSIDSKTPAAKRKELVDNFKQGKIDIIVNVDIFSEGFDCPDIEFIQLARPTRSLVKYLQQVGRGLRPTENKANCIILDNVGMYSRFGLPNARRHWKQHFLGKNVDEEPKKTVSKGTGKSRYVDLSEGTEDMELIQDVYEEVEVKEEYVNHSADEVEKKEEFDPIPMLLENKYVNDNFVFWSDDNKHIYEAYIQDDKYFIISELIVDKKNYCVHRNRVGRISMDSWMFSQMECGKVDHLNSITHYGANYTVFHYQEVSRSGKTKKNRYFDYKGREVDVPTVVEVKYEKAKREGHIHDYIDVPVSKATFGVELEHSRILIIRTCKGESRPIAKFPIQSDFGKKYYNLDNHNIQLDQSALKKLGKYKNDKIHIYVSGYDTFTSICNNDGKNYICKYDLRGNLVNEELIVDGNDVKTSASQESNTDKLWHVFDKKVTSYKYFWFLAIVSLAKEKDSLELSYNDILVRMAAIAWPIVFEYEIDLGRTDRLTSYLEEIVRKTSLIKTASSNVVNSYLSQHYYLQGIEQILSPLLKNVPYRFLSPWISYTSDAEVVEKSRAKDFKGLYAIYPKNIIINKEWWDYINSNYDEVCNFAIQSFKSYVKQYNSDIYLVKLMTYGWPLIKEEGK